MNIVLSTRKKWLDAIHNRNLYNILDCYHKNNTFKGTLSKKVTYNMDGLRSYFGNLLQMKPSVTFIKSDLKKIGDLYFDSGIYVFTFSSSKQLSANYQFVYRIKNGESKIVSHFSSSIE